MLSWSFLVEAAYMKELGFLIKGSEVSHTLKSLLPYGNQKFIFLDTMEKGERVPMLSSSF